MAVRAAESCIQDASIDRSTIGLLLHSGVYRDEFQSEPALAAMAAGRLGINHLGPSSNGEKTLAFDLTNGAVGPLNACFAATHWILAGRAARALVLASEVENNARIGPEALIGVQETGSAMLFEESSNGEGFGRFFFRSFAEYVADIRAFTVSRAGIAMLERECDPEWEQHAALGLRMTLAELLESEALSRDDIALVLPPQGSPRFIALLAEFLELPRGRFFEVPGDHGDSLTSSLAYGFEGARRAGRARRGDLGLILSAGSGGQVGCCVYHF
jgi:3-oxoacyl-[acyl-carrier-protein] synthase III